MFRNRPSLIIFLLVITIFLFPQTFGTAAIGNADGGEAKKMLTVAEPLGKGWYRHWFKYGDIDIEDEQVGVGTGYVYYLTATDRFFNFSYPGPNRMRNIITYVEGEFITDTSFVDVFKVEGDLWQRFILFQVGAKKFHYFNFQLVAWAI